MNVSAVEDLWGKLGANQLLRLERGRHIVVKFVAGTSLPWKLQYMMFQACLDIVTFQKLDPVVFFIQSFFSHLIKN